MIPEELVTLAESMGVTAEYLWTAMLKQAPFDAAVGLALIFAVAGATWAGARFKPEKKGKDYEFLVAMKVFGLGLAIVLWVTMIIELIPMVYAGLFNPEYWALMKILGELS